MKHHRARRFDRWSLTVALVAVALLAPPALAFCGFFAGVSDAWMENSSTQTVIVREGSSRTLTLDDNNGEIDALLTNDGPVDLHVSLLYSFDGNKVRSVAFGIQ